jgi:hypothetical protein
MAAGSFDLVKIGDLRRLLYVAKSFTTGLTDISANVRDPSAGSSTISWTANPATGFAELGNGIYYHDWDSTGKEQGVWSFKIDSSSKNAPGITKVQVVDGDTLNDTVFEKLDTMLDTVLTNLAIVDQNVDDIEAVVTNATYGNASLKTILDTINNTVNALQNNADAKISLIDMMLIPDTGSVAYKFKFRYYDSNNNMEDPDNQNSDAYVAVSVANSIGTDRSANLGALSSDTYNGLKWMTRDAQGVYSATYTVTNGDAEEDLIFTFDLEEGSAPQSFSAISRTSESSADLEAIKGSGFVSGTDSLVAIRDAMDSYLDDGGTIDVLIDAILSELADGTYGLPALQTLITTVDTVVDGIQTDLDNPTDGLGALKAAIDGVQTVLTNDIKGTGWTSGEDLHNIYDLVQHGGLAF